MSDIQLKELTFSQYKRFHGNETLEIKPVTILVGKNSSGKSSITKLIPIISKSMSGLLKNSIIQLDVEGISLGVSYQSLCNNGNSIGLAFGVTYSNNIGISLELISNPKGEIKINTYSVTINGEIHKLSLSPDRTNYIYNLDGSIYLASDFSGFIHTKFLKDLKVDSDFSLNVDYIGPLRSETNRIYYYKGAELSDHVGSKGENAYQLMCSDEQLTKNISNWFEENFNKCRLQVVEGSEKGSYIIQMNKPSNCDFWVNIADEGMGMSQLLPIVIRCMHPAHNSIVVIEQPELHLHPAAHENIAKLFAQTCKKNNQRYIVETHSENILLGLRDAVVDPNIDFTPDDVVIYFVDDDEDGAYLEKITINNEGVLSSWPEGVFNESFEILKKIKSKVSKENEV